ncbi:MAG: CSLREA domain-containing protein, partial [Acidobacteriota bacterium]
MKRLTSSTTFRIFILSVFCLSSIAAILGANLYWASSAASNKGSITLRATARGNSHLNFQNGRELKSHYAASNVANAGIEKAFSSGKGKQGQAQALSLASDDINLDGFPDLVCGYAGLDGGLVTLHLGNPEAFSPTRQETLQGIIKGRYPDPFITDTAVLSVPEAPDFLATGDFNRDGRLDILTAARGGSTLYLLAGDENHGFQSAKALPLPGNVTAMAAPQKSEQDGGMSVAVAIDGQDGPAVLMYAAQRSILDQKPSARALPASITAIVPGRLDEDRSTDLAIIAGGQLYILHGSTRQSAQAALDSIRPDKRAGRLEPVDLPFAVKAVAVSDFIWDRDARMELAVAADSGAVHIVARGELDTRALTASEVLARRELVAQVRRGQRRLADLTPSKPSQQANWAVVETTSLTIPNNGDSAQSLLMSTLASGRQSHDLLVVNPAAKQLQIAFKENAQPGGKEASAARESITFDTGDEPVAALPVRLNVHGRPGLVVMRKGHAEPSIVMATLASTFTVNIAGDTDDAVPGDGTCADSGGACTLRAAVQEANALPGADMITFAASTNGVPIQLTQTGDDNNADNGDLDIIDDVTILGNGAANTIIQGSSDASFTGNMGDKIFGINQDGIFSTLNVTISGLTVRFTKNANSVGSFTETGGALDVFLTGTGASPGPTVTVTNCTFDSNADQNSYGGAINIDSGDLLGGTNIFRGTVQFTGCTISNNKTLDTGTAASGGGVNLFGDKHDVTFTNCTITGNQSSANIGSNGGGINVRHGNGGTITLNTSTVSNNTAGADGGGILAAGAQTLNITGGSISSNTAQGTGDSA